MDSCLLAFLPDPAVCLGQRLEPFSLAHEMLLRRHQSRFLEGGKTDGAERPSPPIHPAAGALDWETELFLAVFLCCQRWPEVQAELAGPGFTKRIATWRRKVRGFDFAAESLAFLAYLKAGLACPEFEIVELPGKRLLKPGAPLHAVLLTTLMGELGVSQAEAMNMSLPAAHWLYCTHLEREGRITIQSPIECGRRAALEEYAAAHGLQLMKFGQPGQPSPQPVKSSISTEASPAAPGAGAEHAAPPPPPPL